MFGDSIAVASLGPEPLAERVDLAGMVAHLVVMFAWMDSVI